LYIIKILFPFFIRQFFTEDPENFSSFLTGFL